MIPDQIGDYRIEGKLGAGGMGEVYRAYDQNLDRPVAIKLIRTDHLNSPKTRERFKREARAIARLSHFGLAKRLTASEHSLSEEGAILGTLHSMSPEQAQGHDVDHRSSRSAALSLFSTRRAHLGWRKRPAT